MEKKKTFDLSYLNWRGHCGDDGTKIYLTFQPILNTCRMPTGYTKTYIGWKSKQLADKSLNPNIGGVFRGLFCSERIILPSLPCLKGVRIMLETWNAVLKYKDIYSFRKYTL